MVPAPATWASILWSPKVAVGFPSLRSGATASGMMTVFMGIPLRGCSVPVPRAQSAPMAAPDG